MEKYKYKCTDCKFNHDYTDIDMTCRIVVTVEDDTFPAFLRRDNYCKTYYANRYEKNKDGDCIDYEYKDATIELARCPEHRSYKPILGINYEYGNGEHCDVCGWQRAKKEMINRIYKDMYENGEVDEHIFKNKLLTIPPKRRRKIHIKDDIDMKVRAIISYRFGVQK